MSQILIQQYLNELSDLRRVSGTHRESVVREAFKTLLKGWGKSKDLIFIPEYEHKTQTDDLRYVDGALLHALRVPFGYWEAKDEKDDLEAEIAHKFRRGYPQDNIVFEDSREAILIQNKQQVMRCEVDDVGQLGKLLKLFFKYEPEAIADFRKAVEQFKKDLPHVLAALRDMIERAHGDNAAFREGSARFLKHAQDTINPNVTPADVREMLIQHMLTEEIFSHVFDSGDFHRQNNVAKQLYSLEGTFFTGGLKHKTLEGLRPYYAAIKSAAALVSSHHEKQKFLKVIYEGFYKAYNKKAADRLGVVYTPNEIVRFMVESANSLCHKHFGRQLIDKDVEILDPAAGTGTYIAELIEYFRGQPAQLRRKYLTELHANEVAILPYYVANLNIEATYAALMKEYEEYPNLCFVDTLDNTAGLRMQRGQQGDLFGAVSEENVARIKRQNKKKISVIVGNPPYNANQLNENESNKNRDYPIIDERIRETYISKSKAQKTKLYDMYVRFFRWASDRVAENGIVAFISNRSFVERLSFDGVRKCLSDEFNYVYVIDLGGDIRELSGKDGIFLNEEHTIFGTSAAVGIAISFLVKKAGDKHKDVLYVHPCDIRATREQKFAFLQAHPIGDIQFERIRPDEKSNWINLTSNEFGTFPALADKATKAVTIAGQERAIFKLYSLGISTNRDEWVYDLEASRLEAKVRHLVKAYESVPSPIRDYPNTLKWSRNLKRRHQQGRREKFEKKRIVRASYRPYVTKWLYQSRLFIDEAGAADEMFPPGCSNRAICFSDVGSRMTYCVLAVSGPADLHFGAAIDAYQQVPRYRYVDGGRLDNITDWGLQEFRSNYEKGVGDEQRITKDAIFDYVYAVLHDPDYRQRYEQNLKREFPHIPLYGDFWWWAERGSALLKWSAPLEWSDSNVSLAQVSTPA